MPRLSIITINLNNASGLRKTIESVVNQTYTDFEYIVIDGNSIDGSVEVIKEFEDKITYWVSEPDKGIYSAMNKGLRISNGEIITFLNSGDIYNAPFSVEIAINLITRKEKLTKIFFFDLILCSQNRFTLYSVSDIRNKSAILIKGFGHPATFYLHDLLESANGFNESFRISADRELYMRLLLKEKIPFAYFPYAIAVFFEGGLSTNPQYLSQLHLEDQRIIDTYYTKSEKKIIKSKIFKKLISFKYTGHILMAFLNWNLKQV